MKYVFIGLGLLGIVLVSIALEPPAPATPIEAEPFTRGMVIVGSTTIPVDIANTYATQKQGLSGRTHLPEGTGMLFVFEREDLWSMWMKDMLFSIDIVWADGDGEVITIAHEVSPQTYPNSFAPSRPARYVLELPAGFARSHGIAEGTKLVVQ